MTINPPFIYDQPSNYGPIYTSEKGFDTSSTVPQESWTSTPLKPRVNTTGILQDDLNRHPHSSVMFPHGCVAREPIAKNTKDVLKWSRVFLLVLRICSWIGAAGLLVCVIFVKPIGSTMDWIMRVPPAAALLHLTYAVCHLFQSAKARTPASSSSYMIFAAILDFCLIPFQVLIAILARNQLLNALSDGTARWQTILGTDFQRHTIIYSTYLIGIVTAGLHFLALLMCLYLAMKFRKIASLPPDMNPLEDNLTTRGHQKAKASTSTFMTESSNQDPVSPLIDGQAPSEPFTNARADPSFRIHNSQERFNVKRSIDSTDSTTQHARSKNLLWGKQTAISGYLGSGSNNVSCGGNKSAYSVLKGDAEGWDTYPPMLPAFLSHGPLELQHLRDQSFRSDGLTPAPLSTKSKYDFSNRSPKPLGLHPPTPRESTPNSMKGFDIRVLRNIDGNSSAPRVSNPVWQEINLELVSMESSQEQPNTKKHYGNVVGMGSVVRSQARVVSSGVDSGIYSNGVRMREVSGKVAEEGRGGVCHINF